MSWLTDIFFRPAAPAPPEPAPDPSFLAVFGERPRRRDYPEVDNVELRVLQASWDSRLLFWGGVVQPPFSQEDLNKARDYYVEWGLGEPLYFQDRSTGERAAFPDGLLRGYNVSAHTAIRAAGLTVAKYQISMIKQDLTPHRLHPLLPVKYGGPPLAPLEKP